LLPSDGDLSRCPTEESLELNDATVDVPYVAFQLIHLVIEGGQLTQQVVLGRLVLVDQLLNLLKLCLKLVHLLLGGLEVAREVSFDARSEDGGADKERENQDNGSEKPQGSHSSSVSSRRCSSSIRYASTVAMTQARRRQAREASRTTAAAPA